MYLHEQSDGVTAAGVAKHFQLHPNVARHHLDKLASGGYVEIGTERPAGNAGRPSKWYRAAEPEMALDVPVRHDDVLVELLGRTLAELGPERSAELAEEVGIAYGTKMAKSMGEHSTTSFRSALHTVADALSAHGFAAQTKDDGNRLRIVTEHCPFGDAAAEHPVICAVDRGLVKGMLSELYQETAVDLVSSYASGDDHCVTAVAEAETAPSK